MSYNVKLENFLNLQCYKQNKSQKRAALLYCPKCLTNCSAITKCQLKTIFVFVN